MKGATLGEGPRQLGGKGFQALGLLLPQSRARGLAYLGRAGAVLSRAWAWV